MLLREFNGTVIQAGSISRRHANSPIPYIVDVSPLGVIKIAWDKQMSPIKDPARIPPARVAVDYGLFESELFKSSELRRLTRRKLLRQDAWLEAE